MSDLKIKTVDEIPPIVRTTGPGKYDPVLEKARADAPKAVAIEVGDTASGVASYLRRLTDESEFVVEQRKGVVYVQFIGKAKAKK